MKKYTILCIFLSVTGCLNAQLTAVSGHGLPNIGRGQIKLADFNNDNKLDALVVGQTSAFATATAGTAKIGLYLGVGNGTFTDATSAWFPTAPTNVNAGMLSIADFDRDGDIDFSYAGRTEAGVNVIHLYKNNGSSFEDNTTAAFTGTTAPTGCYMGTIQWGDIDNDGDLDLIVSGRSYSSLNYPTTSTYRVNVFMIYKNNGNGTFTQSVSNTTLGVCYGQALFIDIENDGDLDIYYSGGGNIGGYMLNDGTGVFAAVVSNNTTRGSNMVIGDFNNDGIQDMLQSYINTNTTPLSAFRMLYNTSTSSSVSFISVTQPSVYGLGGTTNVTNMGVLSSVDYDADGDLDYTVQGLNSSSVPTTSLFLNNALTITPTFTDAGLTLTGLHYGGAEWADLNSDGMPDLITFGYSDAIASISATVVYLNGTNTGNTAPLAPSSLSATGFSGNLLWTMPASADDHTPNTNLTYNVRIGTTPGSSDIMKAAVYGQGKYTCSSAVVRGLADGTYYWSVQAVDGANVAGAWSTESTLTISNPTTVPTTQASNLTTSAVTATSLNVAWTNGDGYKTAVFVKSGSNTSDLPAPVNNTKYLANSLYISGSQIGTSGWYCVYNDAVTPLSAGTVDVYGLAAQTSYQVVVISYNSDATNTTINYLSAAGTNNPVVVTMVDFTVPTILTSALAVTANATGTSVGITPSQSGTTGWDNSYTTVVFIKLGSDTNEDVPLVANTTYTANASSTNTGNVVGSSTWHCVYKANSTYIGNGAFAQLPFITGLSPYTTYQVRACTYNGTAGHEKYSQTTGIVFTANVTNAPTIQAKNLAASAITQTSLSLDWTNGNGYKTAIFVKAGNSVADLVMPVANTMYSANLVFKSGTQIGTSGWYCVYNNAVTLSSAGTTLSISGLNPLTSYQVVAVSYNSDPTNTTINYLTAAGSTANPLVVSTIDYAVPIIITSALTVTTNTGGTEVGITPGQSGTIGWEAPYTTVVFMKQGSDANEDVTLTSNTTYTGNTYFSTSGSQVGTSGWYCVFNENTTYLSNGLFAQFPLFIGLTANTSYQVRACTYNGTPGYEKYSATAGVLLTTPPNNVTAIENSIEQLKVYPTLSHGSVNIDGLNMLQADFYSITGVLVKQVRLCGNKNVLNISNLSDGLYFLKVRLNDGSLKTENIILQK